MSAVPLSILFLAAAAGLLLVGCVTASWRIQRHIRRAWLRTETGWRERLAEWQRLQHEPLQKS